VSRKERAEGSELRLVQDHCAKFKDEPSQVAIIALVYGDTFLLPLFTLLNFRSEEIISFRTC